MVRAVFRGFSRKDAPQSCSVDVLVRLGAIMSFANSKLSQSEPKDQPTWEAVEKSDFGYSKDPPRVHVTHGIFCLYVFYFTLSIFTIFK